MVGHYRAEWQEYDEQVCLNEMRMVRIGSHITPTQNARYTTFLIWQTLASVFYPLNVIISLIANGGFCWPKINRDCILDLEMINEWLRFPMAITVTCIQISISKVYVKIRPLFFNWKICSKYLYII